jgi:hypothetical protein
MASLEQDKESMIAGRDNVRFSFFLSTHSPRITRKRSRRNARVKQPHFRSAALGLPFTLRFTAHRTEFGP